MKGGGGGGEGAPAPLPLPRAAAAAAAVAAVAVVLAAAVAPASCAVEWELRVTSPSVLTSSTSSDAVQWTDPDATIVMSGGASMVPAPCACALPREWDSTLGPRYRALSPHAPRVVRACACLR